MFGPFAAGAHQGACEARHHYGFVYPAAYVHDPGLYSIEVLRQPYVPVDFGRVGHDARGDQGFHQCVVLGVRLEDSRRAGDGQPAPDLRAVAGVPRILAEPEGGVGREREHRCEPQAQPVHHPDRRLAVAQADVDVEAERDLLPGQPLVALHDPLVALFGRDPLVPPVRERVRARRGDPGALLRRRIVHLAPETQDLGAHLRERAANRTDRLDLRGQ